MNKIVYMESIKSNQLCLQSVVWKLFGMLKMASLSEKWLGFTSFTKTLLRERTRIVFLLTLSHMYALESLKISLYVKLSSDNKEIDLCMY